MPWTRKHVTIRVGKFYAVDHISRTLVITLSCLLLCFATLGTAARAAVIVTDYRDVIAPGDGLCALREAVAQTNNRGLDLSGGDCDIAAEHGTAQIEFGLSLPATILLEQGSLVIETDTKINGPGSDLLLVDGAGTFRVIEAQLDLEIRGLTIANGAGEEGGAILADGRSLLKLVETAFVANTAAAEGGAIAFRQPRPSLRLEVENSSFRDNVAIDGGGAISVRHGRIAITSSTFAGNEGYRGGAIYLRRGGGGSVSIVDTYFGANHAADDGGGAYIDFPSARIVLDGSTFVGNVSAADGGGLHIEKGHRVEIVRSAFASNEAASSGGLHVRAQRELFLSNSTIAENSAAVGPAGGVFYADDDDDDNDARPTEKTALFKGDDDDDDATAIFESLTITANEASNGNIGGIRIHAEEPELNNVVAGHNIAAGIERDVRIVDGDAAVIRASTIRALRADDPELRQGSRVGLQYAVDLAPAIETLATEDRSSVTVTAAPLPGSPLIDSGSGSARPDGIDQRGFAGQIGPGVDRGAHELGPTLSLIAPKEDVFEGGAGVLVTALVAEPATTPIRVQLHVVSCSLEPCAAADDIALPNEGAFVIPAGEMDASIEWFAIDDGLIEGTEELRLQALAGGAQSDNAALDFTIVEAASAPTVPTLSLQLLSSDIVEGEQATLTARLDRPATVPVRAKLSFGGDVQNEDFLAAGEIVIPTGALSSSIPVRALLDQLYEPASERLQIELDEAVGADFAGPETLNLMITDGDGPPSISLEASTDLLVEPAGSSAIRARLTYPSTQSVSLTLRAAGSATDASDYVVPKAIVIPAGQLEGTSEFSLLDDDLAEFEESAVISIEAATGATFASSQRAEVRIQDDDEPLLLLTLNNSPMSETGDVATITARLSQPALVPVTIELNFSGQALFDVDYFVNRPTLTIPVGATAAATSMIALNDFEEEGDEGIQIEVASVSGAAINSSNLIYATIADDETTPVVHLESQTDVLVEGGAAAELAVVLSHPSAYPVTARLDYRGSVDALDLDAPSQVIIPAGASAASFTVQASDDTLIEGFEQLVVQLQGVDNAIRGKQAAETFDVIDNDESVPSFGARAEIDTFLEAGGMGQLRLLLSSTVARDTGFELTASGSATEFDDFFLDSNYVVIPAGTPSLDIPIQPLDDLIVEGIETITLQATSSDTVNGSVAATTFQLIDDESPPIVRVEVDPPVIAEQEQSVIRVSTSAPAGANLRVRLELGGSAIPDIDYLLETPELVIETGQQIAEASLFALWDSESEGAELVELEIADAEGAEIDPVKPVIRIVESQDIFSSSFED